MFFSVASSSGEETRVTREVMSCRPPRTFVAGGHARCRQNRYWHFAAAGGESGTPRHAACTRRILWEHVALADHDRGTLVGADDP
jgi:hypothetical protein